MQYSIEKCIKIFGKQIRPPSRGNFYALTMEVKFHGKARGIPTLLFLHRYAILGFAFA